MIYDNIGWVEVDDHDTTEGNGYATHTIEPYKGRVQRNGYTTITKDETTKYVEIIQLPMPEYVKFDQVVYSASSKGEQVAITGKTNAPRLAFSIENDSAGMATLPDYFDIQPDGDVSPTEEQDVSGQEFDEDPGASKEIAFEIVVTISANDAEDGRRCTLVAVGTEGVRAVADIVQEGEEK